MTDLSRRKAIVWTVLIILMALSLGLFTTSEYVRARGIQYIEQGNQIERHLAVIEGHARNPWQYRVLAPYLLCMILGLFKSLHIPHHIAVAFIGFRILQDTLVLLLSYLYYTRLGISLPNALIGMAVLAWGMSYSHYDSDLQFNTFFDIIFYLLAALSILHGTFIWIAPITLLAALNRETSGLIPFLLLAVAIFAPPPGSWRKAIPVFIISLIIYLSVFVGLRLVYGIKESLSPYGHQPGLDLLQYNLSRLVTWHQLIATLSIIPIVAVVGYKKWSVPIRVFFWVIVPIWFSVHAFGAVMAETRLFLVPQALVFIPGALLTLTEQEESVHLKRAP